MASRIPLNRPLWLEDADTRYPALAGDVAVAVDVAVVGAGMAGVTTAYLLRQAGKSVALLEGSRVGFGATGYTTAKLTVGHNLVYRDLADRHGEDAARRYARSNQEAIERVTAIVREHGIECDLEDTSNFVYTESEAAVGDLEQELAAATGDSSSRRRTRRSPTRSRRRSTRSARRTACTSAPTSRRARCARRPQPAGAAP